MNDLIANPSDQDHHFALFNLYNAVRQLDILDRRLALSNDLFAADDWIRICTINRQALQTLLVCTRHYRALPEDFVFKGFGWVMGVEQAFQAIRDGLPRILMYDRLDGSDLLLDRELLIQASTKLAGFYIQECLDHLSRLPKPEKPAQTIPPDPVMSARDALRQPYQRTDRNLPR